MQAKREHFARVTAYLNNNKFAFRYLFLLTAISTYLFSWLIILMDNYSNVPYWDEWNSRMEMNPYTNSINIIDFWEPSNEHRIVFSRILFFLGFIFANGSSLFLILVNFSLQMLLTFLFIKRTFLGFGDNLRNINLSGILLIFAIVSMQFSSLQRDNFTWAFQSGFFTLTLLSFLAFDHISRFIVNFQGKVDKHYWLAILFGVLSVGTMGSGIFVLPILALVLFITRIQLKYVLLTLFFTTITSLMYFLNFEVESVSPLDVVNNSGIKSILTFVNFFMTAPMYEVLGQTDTYLTNVFFMLIVIIFVRKVAYVSKRSTTRSYHHLMGIGIITFVALSALSTAIGRVSIGVEQAYASRYMTVGIYGFLGFLFLIRDSTFQQSITKRFSGAIFFSIILVFGHFQYQSLTYQNVNVNAQKSAALALSLQINDSELMQYVFYDYTKAQEIANKLVKNRQSVFGESYIQDIQGKIGKKIQTNKLPNCENLEVIEVKRLSELEQYRFLLQSKSANSSKVSEFIPLDSEGNIVGGSYAFQEGLRFFGLQKSFLFAKGPVSEIVEIASGSLNCTKRVVFNS